MVRDSRLIGCKEDFFYAFKIRDINVSDKLRKKVLKNKGQIRDIPM